MPAPSRTTNARVAGSTQAKQSKTAARPLTDADSNSPSAMPSSRKTYAQVVGSNQSKQVRTVAQPANDADSTQGSRSSQKTAQDARSKQSKQTGAVPPPVNDAEENIQGSRSSQKTASSLDKENISNRTPRERRPSEKIVANRDKEEEAARRQELLEANRAERAKRAERKVNKSNGVDRPAQSDDEERETSSFTSQSVVTKQAGKKAALVQRQTKVAPTTPAHYSRTPKRAIRTSLSRSRSRQSRSRSPRRLGVSSHSRQSRSRSPRGRRMSPTRFSSPYRDQALSDSGFASLEREHPRSVSRSCSPQREASRSRSPSQPLIGRKRSLSSSDDGLLQLAKAQKVSEGGGRPKASDYDEVAKEVILCATAIYRCLVSTSNAFPTPSEEGELIKFAWNRANEETSQDVPIGLTPGIAKVISARGSQIRSEVKSRALDYVETLYGFNSGHGKSILKSNRKLAEDLKTNNSGYLYKNLETKTGLYQHPIVQRVVNRCWFNNSRDEGIVYGDLFDPLSVEAIALVLTAIECGIDAWATGINVEVPFYSSDYKPVYIRHVKTLKAFGVATSKHDLLGKLQRSLFNFGRVHAGVPSTITQNGPMLSEAAFLAAMKEYEEDDVTEEDGEDVD